MADVSELSRKGLRSFISRLLAGNAPDQKLEGLAEKLEAHIYETSRNIGDYLESKDRAERNLGLKLGEWGELNLVEEFCSGRMTAAEILRVEEPQDDPRQMGRILIYRVLKAALRDAGVRGAGVRDAGVHGAGERDAGDQPSLKEIATKVEQSCYDAVIEGCLNQESAPIRQWSSPEFRSIYNARVATVTTNLDRNSSVGATYGTPMLDKLISGEIGGEAIGGMRSRDLCPEAYRHEVEEFEARLNQKIKVSISKVYRCPFCGARDSTTRSVQTRSLDEAATIFCTCRKCNGSFTGK